MATPYGHTADGFETQFGTNHLAHFLLFLLLRPLLLASASPAFPSRVVNLSSSGHRSGPVLFGDHGFENHPYSPWAGYGQAKTANIYLANEIERRYGAKHLHGTSLMPGGIETGLQKYDVNSRRETWGGIPAVVDYMKSPAQGAATTVYAAVAEEWKDKGGKYLEDCAEATPWNPDEGVLGLGYRDWAYNEEGEGRLWRDSLEMVGMKEDQA